MLLQSIVLEVLGHTQPFQKVAKRPKEQPPDTSSTPFPDCQKGVRILINSIDFILKRKAVNE
jgi:hypothetical protein